MNIMPCNIPLDPPLYNDEIFRCICLCKSKPQQLQAEASLHGFMRVSCLGE